MIAEFTVENYRSFKEKCTFSLISTKSKDLSESNTFKFDKNLNFLRSAVIYGANASGKSNFFHALDFFLFFSVKSGPNMQIDDPTGTDIFSFSKQTENKPSFFEITFYITVDTEKKIKYRYSLSLTENEIVGEYLHAVYNVREVNLFSREGQEISITSYFKEGNRSKQSVRNNCSFLSVCAQNNGEISTEIIRYFNNMVVSSGIYNNSNITGKMLNDQKNKNKILEFLQNADIQITGIKTEIMHLDSKEYEEPEVQAFLNYLRKKMPDIEEQETFYFGHPLYDGEKVIGEKFLSENYESDGTRKLFSYSIPILNALENGTPIFIDEFDNSLHPLIIENILKLFNSSTINKKNAQLVISCHAVNIMTNKLLRRDQIWFCEKDKYGATDLFSLLKYNDPVRKDAAYNKNYLQGKYGAIPYINEIMLQVASQ
jgi:AAA15 family ATPase/GTPase